VRDPLGYQQAIGALRQYSLIKISQDRQALSVHRLVQAVTRQQVDPEQQDQWATAALRLLRAAFPDRLGDAAAWSEYARLLPHALAVVEHTAAGGIDFDQTAWLVGEAGVYLWQRAEHQQARRLHGCALAIYEARLGAEHPDTATSLNNLALVLRDQGDLDGARPLHERALAIREARLGPDHPETAKSRRNLAAVVDRLETHS
jgi:tetratricopeptide (TPR) repeat protein